MKLSVEIEPPKGIFIREDEVNSPLYLEVINYINFVELISITNRPVFGLSPLTLASQIKKIVDETTDSDIRINLHLTTRLSHFDTFKYVLDAHRAGISDLLPILGDPRGPINESYFQDGFEILGFVSFLKSGNPSLLSHRYMKLFNRGILKGPIKKASYSVGNVVDVNPLNKMDVRNEIEIRNKQISFAQRKEQLGAEYLISQAIFDADYYFDFIDQADLGIPVLAGLMPARVKLINMFGLPIDHLEKQRLRAAVTTREEREIGNKLTGQIFRDLEDRGCQYAHIYSIGNYENFCDISGHQMERETPLSDIRKVETKA